MDNRNPEDYLLESLKTGDEKGILKIYELVFPKVLQYLLNNNGTKDNARDIMQSALLQITLRARTPGFTIESTLEGYIFTICRNAWRREKKIQQTKVTNSDSLPPIDDTQEVILACLEQEKWELFQEKLQVISDNCQQLLKHYFAKISYDKIAEQLGYANENVVRQRMFKCKKKLKEVIQADVRYREIKGL